jgi:hypothetical protein
MCTASWHRAGCPQEESRLGEDLSTCCLCPPWTQNTWLTGLSCWPPIFLRSPWPSEHLSFSRLYPEQLIHRSGLQDGGFSPWRPTSPQDWSFSHGCCQCLAGKRCCWRHAEILDAERLWAEVTLLQIVFDHQQCIMRYSQWWAKLLRSLTVNSSSYFVKKIY